MAALRPFAAELGLVGLPWNAPERTASGEAARPRATAECICGVSAGGPAPKLPAAADASLGLIGGFHFLPGGWAQLCARPILGRGDRLRATFFGTRTSPRLRALHRFADVGR